MALLTLRYHQASFNWINKAHVLCQRVSQLQHMGRQYGDSKYYQMYRWLVCMWVSGITMTACVKICRVFIYPVAIGWNPLQYGLFINGNAHYSLSYTNTVSWLAPPSIMRVLWYITAIVLGYTHLESHLIIVHQVWPRVGTLWDVYGSIL